MSTKPVYTREMLVQMCMTNPHPEVRRICAGMLYDMGKADQAEEEIRCIQRRLETFPANESMEQSA